LFVSKFGRKKYSGREYSIPLYSERRTPTSR